MKFRNIVASSVCGMLLTGSAFAQQTTTGKSDPVVKDQLSKNNQTGAQAKEMKGEHSLPEMILSCLALENQEEIILAKLAVEKSQEKDVQAFAKKLIAAHDKCLKDLTKIDPSLANRELLVDQSPSSNDRSSTTAQTVSPQKQNSRNSDAQNSSFSTTDMFKMQMELAQQCLADSKAMLVKDGGKHFDECYVGMEIAKHAAMQSKLTVYQRHATGELKDLITNGLAMTKDHLAQAETLMKSLAAQEASPERAGK